MKQLSRANFDEGESTAAIFDNAPVFIIVEWYLLLLNSMTDVKFDLIAHLFSFQQQIFLTLYSMLLRYH